MSAVSGETLLPEICQETYAQLLIYLLFGERLMAQLTTTSKLAEQVAKRMVPKRLVPS